MTYSLWFAFLGGLGTFLALNASQRRAPRTLRVRLGLEQVQARRPLVDRLFGTWAETLLQRRDATDVETRLKQAGFWQRVGALYPDVRLVVALGIALLTGSIVTLLRPRPRSGERRTFPAIPWLALGTAMYLVLATISHQPSAISF